MCPIFSLAFHSKLLDRRRDRPFFLQHNDIVCRTLNPLESFSLSLFLSGRSVVILLLQGLLFSPYIAPPPFVARRAPSALQQDYFLALFKEFANASLYHRLVVVRRFGNLASTCVWARVPSASYPIITTDFRTVFSCHRVYVRVSATTTKGFYFSSFSSCKGTIFEQLLFFPLQNSLINLCPRS